VDKRESAQLDLKGLITWRKLSDALKSLSSLRIHVSRSSLLTVSALAMIFVVALSVRLLPIRWGMELSEFDPYFQFQSTEKILKDGYLEWLTWTTGEAKRWYPLEVAVGQQAYPGLHLTAAVLFGAVSALGVPVTLYDFCIIFPAVFGALACLALFFFANDVGGKAVGLFSAFFLALNASHISRTSAGFFDDETVGIGAILLFSFLFLRALDEKRPQRHSLAYAVTAGLVLGYLTASWGAALYPIAMTTLFVLVLVLLRRYTRRLFLSYSLTFGLGLFLATTIPKNSTSYLTTWAILPVLGVFGLLCLSEALRVLTTRKWKLALTALVLAIIVAGLLGAVALGYSGTIAGKFISVLNPAQREESQIYQSVQEHRLTAWGSIYYDYGVTVLFFVVGLFFAVRDLTTRNLFMIIFGLTTLYFASSMVRLTILMAPAFAILISMGIVNLLRPFIALLKRPPKVPSGRKLITGHVGKEFSGSVLILIFLLLTLTYAIPSPRMYSHAYSPVTILSASLPIRPTDAVTAWTETLEWMNLNLPEDAIICSWWDYGYWISVKGNRTSLADNSTFNATHIGNIGLVFMSNETEAIRILSTQFNGPKGPPTHILVFTSYNDYDGSDQGYGDEGKWRWMARIANQTVAPGFYKEWGDREQYNTFGNITDEGQWTWNDVGENTTIYRLMENAKKSVMSSLTVPTLEHFRAVHFSPATPAASLGTAGGTTVYLYATVALYEIIYDG
jgi:dolichyl-diphosphooligosaccharide--protein glycosyltransferase